MYFSGWPEFWFSWAFQFKALADAGYHVFAMDLRGKLFLGNLLLHTKKPEVANLQNDLIISK
jgi:hypothetical protein